MIMCSVKIGLRVPVTVLISLFCSWSFAEPDWMSVTIDNDVFIGNDSGYTNGLFVSWYNVGTGDNQNKRFERPSVLVRPLIWTLPLSTSKTRVTVNAYTIGQIMVTPKDITNSSPGDDELPYSGLLFFNSSYLLINDAYADEVTTTIGVVGPLSGAKSTQKWLHEILGADDPSGWSTQLHDELVFRFSRGRIWRGWSSPDGDFDILYQVEGALGTISSSFSSGVTLRYGSGLTDSSFATPLFSQSKTSNPASINGGWYTYVGVSVSYLFNQIFTDGNTFKESRSVDYSHDRLGVAAGIAYSWNDLSITAAVNDYSAYEDKLEKRRLGELTRYGTVTVAWRFK